MTPADSSDAPLTAGSGRPVIGLTAYVEPVDRGVWIDQRSVVLPHDYVAKIEAAGGLAVVLPPRGDLTDGLAQELLARLDGLVVTGGADVESATYGQDPHAWAQEARPERDRSELVLVRVARRLGMPILGICRGMQIMAVEAGGTLEQHVPDRGRPRRALAAAGRLRPPRGRPRRGEPARRSARPARRRAQLPPSGRRDPPRLRRRRPRARRHPRSDGGGLVRRGPRRLVLRGRAVAPRAR